MTTSNHFTAPHVPGGSTPDQYAFPEWATELQHLIRHRGMNFALGNIFKACYRLGHCDHSTRMRDLQKIKWFAEELIAEEQQRIEAEELEMKFPLDDSDEAMRSVPFV